MAKRDPSSGPLRALCWGLAALVLAAAYDAVALLPLFGGLVPLHVAARIQDASATLRWGLALLSFGAIWLGLYGVYGPRGRAAPPARRRRSAAILWTVLALAAAAMALPAFWPMFSP